MSFNFLTGMFHKANQGIAGGGDWPTLTDPMAGIKPQLPGAMGQPTLERRLVAGALGAGSQIAQQPQVAPPSMQLQQIQSAPLAQVQTAAQGMPIQGLLAPQQLPKRPYMQGLLGGHY